MEAFDPNKQQVYKEADYANGRKTIVTIAGEEFRPYPLNPRYLVSNMGEAYDLFTGKKLVPYSIQSGYYRFHLEQELVLAHRMVAYTFLDPNDPHYGEVVNHLNEIKTCNRADNLEWTTDQDNILYSARRRKSAPAPIRVYTNQDKHAVCRMMQEGYSNRQIADYLGIEYDQQLIKLLSGIRTGRKWTKIASLYTFPSVQVKAEEVERICQLLEQGLNGPQIANVLGKVHDSNFAALLSDIRLGKRWKSVSSKYNVKPVNKLDLEAEAICQMLASGYTSQQIADRLGVTCDHHFITFLSFIRTGRTFREISSRYPEIVKGYTVDESKKLKNPESGSYSYKRAHKLEIVVGEDPAKKE